MKLRDSFNSSVRKLGNGIYDGLGDKLTSEINLKSMAKKSLVGILAAGAIFSLPGCSTYPIKKELVVQYWKDFNENERLDAGEILGQVGDSINLDKYGLRVDLVNPSRQPTVYFALDSYGNKISQDIKNEPWYWNTHGYFGNWINILNRISKEKPGEYTIGVQQRGDPEVFKKTINITRDSIRHLKGIDSSVK